MTWLAIRTMLAGFARDAWSVLRLIPWQIYLAVAIGLAGWRGYAWHENARDETAEALASAREDYQRALERIEFNARLLASIRADAAAEHQTQITDAQAKFAALQRSIQRKSTNDANAIKIALQRPVSQACGPIGALVLPDDAIRVLDDAGRAPD